ncbi:PAS domain-containing sensor histidine kinase [Flagellimonas sp. 389]|uniref:sensor histidine kinase n=1 Tax=Flagellimonas sp. 389 TaxID=2835862 RepID=UPI001BD33FCA|nr:ATP-binding protein [Flagellimonas sp. 389]MBS9461436.1 PAS domain-containing sensor histidine kinase [Flagellimonas sp. 389]
MKSKIGIFDKENRLIPKHGDDVTWSINQDYQLTFFSHSFEQQFVNDFQIAPEIGMDLRSLGLNDVFFHACSKGYAAALKGKPLVYLSTIQKDGRGKVFELSFLPFHNVSGEVLGCCMQQKDVTAESEALQLLEDRDRKYKEAQEIANVGHWNWDMLKNEISWSDQLFRVFGQKPGNFEATYEALMDIIHPEDREAFNADVETSIKENVLHDMVHRIMLGENDVRYVHQKGRAYYNSNGKPIRMSGTTQDVTSEILANQRIVEQNKELEHFVHVVSHNLKGPISNLLMLLSVYNWGRDTENDIILKKFETTSKALHQTMKDLNLSLSLRSVDKERFRDIYFESAMEDVLGLLSEEIVKTGTSITMRFSKAPTMKGVKSYVVNILYNLILNAITYKQEGRTPKVRISTMLKEGSLILTVADNGIGIKLTPEREKKIFDMYGRLSGKTEGKGLGLYLVKTQAEAMNGRIGVKSETGIGSSFTIRFELPPDCS